MKFSKWLKSDFIPTNGKVFEFTKISMPSDLASNITPMIKFWVTYVLSVGRYRRKLATDIDQLVYGEAPSKSKYFSDKVRVQLIQ